MASKFGDFLAAYTNQIGARNTADYNRAKADQARMDVNKNKISNTISELHNNEKIFDSSGRLNKTTGLAAMHDPNIASQYVNFLNTASVANQFKDQFGTKQRGTLLAPTKNKDGTYTFNIRDHRGKIKPVTGRRSGDPDDAPVTLTKEELVAFYEAQSENLLQRGGLTGRAVGKTIGNQLDTQFDQAYGAAGKLLGDENVDDPEQTANGMGEIIQIINKNRPPEEKEAIANMDDGLEAEDITGAAAALASGTVTEKDLPGTRQLAKEEQFNQSSTPEKESEDEPYKYIDETSAAFNSESVPNRYKKSYTSLRKRHERLTMRIAAMDEKADAGGTAIPLLGGEVPVREGREYKIAKKQLLETESKLREKEEEIKGFGKKDTLKLENRNKALEKLINNPSIGPKQKQKYEDELAANQAKIGSATKLGTGLKEETSELTIANLPDLPDTNNMDDARSWFTNNQETLKNLPQEDYNKIQTLLQEKNINSAADMAKAVREGALKRKDALKAAALIAFTVNAGATGDQAAVGRQQSMFGTLANTFLQGDPNVDSNMAANTRSLTASRQQSAALAQSKWAQSTMSGLGETAQEATNLLVVDGEFVDLTDGSEEAMAATKAFRNFFADVETQKAFLPESGANPAMNHTIGEVLLALGSQGSVGFMDWFGDFPAGDTQIPAGEALSRVRKRTNSRGVVELVFVNASEPSAETEFSVLPKTFVDILGPAAFNYTLGQVPDLVENKPVKEVTGS